MSFLPSAPGQPSAPALLATQLADARAGGVTYHIAGELVPVLAVDLAPGQTIFFEHHILLWKDPSLQFRVRPLAGMVKRLIAGMELLIVEAVGPGQVAFSRDGVGHVFPVVLMPGQELDVREHQFLAATGNIDFTWQRVQGVANICSAAPGFSSTGSRPAPRRVSSGCTATATSSRRRSRPASNSTSSRAAGSTRTRASRWRPTTRD
jgi:Mitochondrial biogenesis AIM24